MVYRMYCLNSLWMVYMIHENYDLVLMTPRCGMIMMIYIYVIYNDLYEGFILVLWVYTWGFTVMITQLRGPYDGPMERSHTGLIDVMICPRRGWCG